MIVKIMRNFVKRINVLVVYQVVKIRKLVSINFYINKEYIFVARKL